MNPGFFEVPVLPQQRALGHVVWIGGSVFLFWGCWWGGPSSRADHSSSLGACPVPVSLVRLLHTTLDRPRQLLALVSLSAKWVPERELSRSVC